jgi:hypothetical protein
MLLKEAPGTSSDLVGHRNGGGGGNRKGVHSNEIRHLQRKQVPQECLMGFRLDADVELSPAAPCESANGSLHLPQDVDTTSRVITAKIIPIKTLNASET